MNVYFTCDVTVDLRACVHTSGGILNILCDYQFVLSVINELTVSHHS